MNDPLDATDPSGYFLKWLERKVRREWKLSSLFRGIASVAAAFAGQVWMERALIGAGEGFFVEKSITGQLVLTTEGAVLSGVVGGFAGGFVGSSGDIEAALRGGLTGAAFGFVGGEFTVAPMNYVGHAVVGCLSAEMEGGKCGPGAAGALLGKIVSSNLNVTRSSSIEAQVGGGIVTALAGAIGAQIAGGDVKNGALTAAFGYLFNQLGSSPEDSLTPHGGAGIRITIDDVSNFSAGVGDTLSFGGTVKVREWLDIGSVDSNSTAYGAGEVAGVGIGVVSGSAGLRAVAGPMKQWVRLGPSYSKAGGFHVDMSVRWGASPAGGGRYVRQIPSVKLQELNQWLRSQRVPLGGWRGADPGHFHLWR